MGNFGYVKDEVEAAPLPLDRATQNSRAAKNRLTLLASRLGVYLLVLLVPPAALGGPAKVKVREGRIPPESIQLIYQIALDQVSVSYAVQRVPKLDVYFMTNLEPERFAEGRTLKWTFSYAKGTGPHDGSTVYQVQKAAVVMRKVEPWELWSESADFNVLLMVMIGILDYANQIYIGNREMETLRAAGLSQWECQIGRSCDWKLLGKYSK